MKFSFLLTLRRLFQTLTAHACFFQLLKEQVAHAYDCFWDRFPLTIGIDTGISKISHLAYEANDVLYMAGLS